MDNQKTTTTLTVREAAQAWVNARDAYSAAPMDNDETEWADMRDAEEALRAALDKPVPEVPGEPAHSPRLLSADELRMIEWRARYRPGEEAAAGDNWSQAALDRWNLLCHVAALVGERP